MKNCVLMKDDERISLGYGAAIFDGKECVGAIGIAVRINSEDEKTFWKMKKG